MESGLMFPKPKKKKKRKTHKKSIVKTEKHTCFLCSHLYGDWGYKYTEEHHVLFGSGLRSDSEAEGFKVYLCRKHHKEGPEAVHNNEMVRELLCRIIQQEYEQTHTRQEWMQVSKKNYIPDAPDEKIELAAGDYVKYRKPKGETAAGYIIDIIGFCDVDIAWIGQQPGTINQKIDHVQLEDIMEKVPPPLA